MSSALRQSVAVTGAPPSSPYSFHFSSLLLLLEEPILLLPSPVPAAFTDDSRATDTALLTKSPSTVVSPCYLSTLDTPSFMTALQFSAILRINNSSTPLAHCTTSSRSDKYELEITTDEQRAGTGNGAAWATLASPGGTALSANLSILDSGYELHSPILQST